MEQAFIGLVVGVGLVGLFLALCLAMVQLEQMAQSDRPLFRRPAVGELVRPTGSDATLREAHRAGHERDEAFHREAEPAAA